LENFELVHSEVSSTKSEAAMQDVYERLSDRVGTLIEGHKDQILSTDGTSGAFREIFRRLEGLEKAIREVALEVQKQAASHEHP
jgi:hypothetical protein